MVFRLVLICCGAFLFLRELIDTYIQFVLFFECWRVPEVMRMLQRRSELSLAFGHLSAVLFGLSLIIIGIQQWQGGQTASSITPLLIAFSICMALNLLQKLLFVKKSKVRQKIMDIKEQWRRERRFSALHNYEVDLYHSLKANLDGVGNAALIFAGELLICLFYV